MICKYSILYQSAEVSIAYLMLEQYSHISELLVHTAHILSPKKGSMVCSNNLLQVLDKAQYVGIVP